MKVCVRNPLGIDFNENWGQLIMFIPTFFYTKAQQNLKLLRSWEVSQCVYFCTSSKTSLLKYAILGKFLGVLLPFV